MVSRDEGFRQEKCTLPKKIDLTGQKFGKLTVLRLAENIGGRTAWVCQCDCGQEITVRTNALRSGNTKSCGCRCTKEHEGLTLSGGSRAVRRRLDLTGRRFGRLTVLRPAENIGGKTAWVCRCDCGQECVIKTNSLREKRSASCGCAGGPENARRGLTFVDGTCVEFIRSEKLQKNNTSGVPGVFWVVRSQLWWATIDFKGKRRYLGRYQNFEDAVKARKRAEEELYGSFLREFALTNSG